MVSEFLNELKTKVREEEYEIIFDATIDDIKFNRCT